MAYQFQYVPTSGDLPGASFEKQTERAINEIGARSDEIQNIAEGAVSIAESALANALNAVETANTANTTAQEANARAQEALNAANSAGSAAIAAQTKADAAYDLAANAGTAAGAAQTSADQAQATAEEGIQNAADAQERADSAYALAEGALRTANAVADIFTKYDDPLDFNTDTYSATVTKLYLTNAKLENGPPLSARPLYFSVATNSTGTSAIQRVFSEKAPDVEYARCATIEIDTEGTRTVTWGAWLTATGTPSGVITMWSGAINTIPKGWALCDGQNGTPNLKDRFIVGAGASYTVGTTGGVNSVTPTGTISTTEIKWGTEWTEIEGWTDNTTLATWQMPAHNHGSGALVIQPGGGHSVWSGGGAEKPTWTFDQGGNGAHSHSLNLGEHQHIFDATHGHTFTGTSQENRPLYYALAYIMKL